jgi:single-strand DNA-binding protein
MANGINMVILSGRLGKDAATKFTASGTSVTEFSLATDRSVKDGSDWKSVTDWHNVIAWKKEALANYLLKGKEVTVTGRIQTRNYDGKDGQKRYVTEIIADQIKLHGGSNGSAQRDTPVPAQGYEQTEIVDDDVPF